ncbi:ankyrin repeat-containing domain protein [Obelidium mucronatum]|nr:ankyrin repeat-containing domain protein [Obelidium mucronatum]
MQPTMPKLLTILGIGAVVAVASIYIPRLKNSPRKQTEADPAEVESLFRAARDPSQTAQFQTLHSKTKKYSPRDAFGKTVFCAAAESFHFAAVRFLVSTETGSLVDSLLFTSSDESGSNVIHLLVANITKENWKDTVAMIKLLLAANTILCLSMGKAKNAVTGKTALMMAVEKCRETPDAFEVVKLLVKLHANVDSTDLDGKTALMLACLSQSTDAVAVWLLQSTPCDFRVLDSGNRSAVFYAIQSECREAAVLLVDRCRAVIKSPASLSSLNSLKRRNTNSSTVSSSSSLISTNTRETKVTIDPLIVADNLDGMTPLLLAIRLGDMALVNLLWSSSSKSDAMLKPLDLASNYPLRLAVLSGSLEIVMWVMENDKASDFTQPDELGTTPFHLAAQLHLPEILSFFLSCLKKNWNFGTCINDNAQTPLHVACDLGVSSVTSDSQHNPQNYVETIRILVKNGSPVSRAMIDDAGLTPLAYYKQSPIRNDALIHKEILGLLAPEPGYNFHENSVNGKSRLQRQILRIPVEVRRRQGLKANVSVEGFVKFLERISEAKKSGSIVGGVCVILGERAFPRRSDGAQYVYLKHTPHLLQQSYQPHSYILCYFTLNPNIFSQMYSQQPWRASYQL